MFLPEVLSTSLECPPSSLTSDNLLWLKTTKQMFADLSLREKAFLGRMLAMFPQLSHGKAGKQHGGPWPLWCGHPDRVCPSPGPELPWLRLGAGPYSTRCWAAPAECFEEWRRGDSPLEGWGEGRML